MSYTGASIPIPFGQLGLKTDEPMSVIAPNALIKANNVTFYNSKIAKSGGSDKYNTTALDGAVVGLFDWWPTPVQQRLIALTSAGKIYRDTGDSTFSAGVPIASGLGTLDNNAHIVAGGSEQAGADRKLFFFSSTNQVKVLSGDGTSVSNISNPAADWSTSKPTYGIVYQGRLIAFGNSNRAHSIYVSKSDDHEVFDHISDSYVFNVFPGEGERIISAAVYRGLLILFKYPLGAYIVNGRDAATPAEWVIQRYSDAFGIASPHATVQVLQDLLGGNVSGSITSLQATQVFGELESGDVLANSQVENFIKSEFDPAGLSQMYALYYPEKKLAMFTGKSYGSANINKILKIDIARDIPRISIETKDQPTCLALRKDSSLIERPIYGADDGHVYIMERSTFNVDGNSYIGEFQTPHMDFSFADQSLGAKNKIFEFVELNYEATGDWDFFVDVYIDNRYTQTLIVPQTALYGFLDTFELDVDRLGETISRSIRIPIRGTGKTISFRVYNNGIDEDFIIERIIPSFRVSGEQQQR